MLIREEVIITAKILEPLTDEEVKQMTVANLRKNYMKLADFFRKIINGYLVYCPHCGQWKTNNKHNGAFYYSEKSIDKIEHFACKECILNECTDYDQKTKIRSDNMEKTINTFKKLDWYFDENVYMEQVRILSENTGERVRGTAVQQYIVLLQSLPNWKGLSFSDSIFINDSSEELYLTSKKKPRKEIIKLFGSGFTTEDYLYLQDQYDDWCSRTQVDSKSQQTYIVRICFKLLDIYKAQKSGKDTDKLDKSLNELLAAANLQPRQNVGNAATDSLTFGQLIEKWEMNEPIPEPSPEFKDVDNISKFLKVWFKGALSRALNLDNGYSREYDEYIKEYTVSPPEYIGDDSEGSESQYEKIFGAKKS